MTTITFTTSDDKYVSVECKGHAGYDDYGKDIVCSAISVLMINLVNSLERFTDDSINLSENEKKGLIKITFDDVPSHDAELLVKSFELGVNTIFQEYGKDYLNIKFRRE